MSKQGVVELVPTDWAWKYRGVDVSPTTDLKDGTEVDLDGLWENILNEGLHDPLIVRVGIKNKKFRLESGNHRIQVFYNNRIELVPVTVQMREDCGPHVGDVMNDATHNFDVNDNLLVADITKEYMKPSEVFKVFK